MSTRAPLLLSFVVPCYNEAEGLPGTARQLLALLERLEAEGTVASGSHVVFVDDGSCDGTWAAIEDLSARSPRVHGVKLTRNYGHQCALLAGLLHASADAAISIDADLQDDLAAVPEMIAAHAAGAEIVYGVRKERPYDGAFKRWTAETYYRLLARMGVNIIYNHADFRLMGRRAIEALRGFREVNLFLRGVIPMLGYPTQSVFYDRQERRAGTTKYPLRKMLSLALLGITSFSAVPLRLITVFGILISLLSFGFGLWTIWARIRYSSAVPGWASTVVPIYFLGGIQLLSLGVIGEYVSRIYLESKARPRFLVEKTL